MHIQLKGLDFLWAINVPWEDQVYDIEWTFRLPVEHLRLFLINGKSNWNKMQNLEMNLAQQNVNAGEARARFGNILKSIIYLSIQCRRDHPF